METVIRKWGNSPAVRIPMAMMSAGKFDLEQKVSLTVEDGRIIIEPVQHVVYSLEALLAGITSGNAHAEVSFGRPAGKESL